MSFKRVTSMLLAGAMIITMTAGLGETVQASEGNVQQIHFYAWTNEENMVPLVGAFNEDYAGQYELVYEKIANADTMTINTALSSGEDIDIMSQASAGDLRDRVDDGVYLGLKQFFDKDGMDYAEMMGDSVEETMNINGDYYAIPYNNNINMVFFNKKMFDEAGIDYPQSGWTWDDFRDTAMALTTGEGANKVYGAMIDVAGTGGGGGDNYWDLIARQKLGAFVYYNDDFTATQFELPEFKTSLEYFYNLAMEDKCIVPYDEYMALQYSNDTTAMAGLYNGKYAMWIAPVYGCLYLKSSYGEIPEGTDIGLVDMPTLEGGETVTTCYTSTVSIPANCKNPEAAWEAIKYICFERADLFAGVKAMNPGYLLKTDEEKEEFYNIIFDEKPGLDKDMAMNTMFLDRTLVSKDCTVSAGQTKITDLVNETMSLVFTGEMGVEEALEKLKTDGDAAIAAELE
ncbi:MAG: extracellular solute-binding protein [Lachnospiraceae bacterium]|nr:extracellular solute-binding protein [Lachnospiraceae bacterium]